MPIQEIKVGNYNLIGSLTAIIDDNENLSFSIKDSTPDSLRVNIDFKTEDSKKHGYTEFEIQSDHEVKLTLYNLNLTSAMSMRKMPFGTYDDYNLYIAYYVIPMNSTSVKQITINLYTQEKING